MPRHGRVTGRSSTRSGATPWQRWGSREPAQWEGRFRACAGCGLFSIPYEALAADAGLVAFARNVWSDALVDASPRGSGCRALRLSGQPRPNSGASNGETDRDDLAIFALTLSAQRPLGEWVYNADQRDHGQPTIGYGVYLPTGHFRSGDLQELGARFAAGGLGGVHAGGRPAQRRTKAPTRQPAPTAPISGGMEGGWPRARCRPRAA